VPEAVGDAKWQEMFEVYVQDRNKLNIREKFQAAENMAAYKAIVDRMVTVIDKGYWQAAPETAAQLRQMQQELIPAVATENEMIAKRAQLQPVPSPTPAPAPKAAASASAKTTPVVKGRVLEEKPQPVTPGGPASFWSPLMLALDFAALALVALGWWRAGRSS
jgi:cobaltochelatase CobN